MIFLLRVFMFIFLLFLTIVIAIYGAHITVLGIICLFAVMLFKLSMYLVDKILQSDIVPRIKNRLFGPRFKVLEKKVKGRSVFYPMVFYDQHLIVQLFSFINIFYPWSRLDDKEYSTMEDALSAIRKWPEENVATFRTHKVTICK